VGRGPAVLARPRPGRADRAVLGQRRRDPPLDRGRKGQEPALAPVGRDLTQLARDGAEPAGPPPLPPAEPQGGGAIEVDRSVSNAGIVSLAGRQILAAEILRGRHVTIRIEPRTLLFFDPDTRELLRARPNPLTPEQALRLRGARPAGPPPRPRSEPVTVQRRVSTTGTICVCRQTVALGRTHARRIVTVHVCEHTSQSNSTTRPAPSAARPPTPPSSSKAAATTNALPKPTDKHSQPATDRKNNPNRFRP
jgi:hypothetical protein